MTLRLLPLHDEHLRLGARMGESEGWFMPMEYAGLFQEYRAHRNAAVVWDSSNLGALRVRGAGAFAAVQRTFSNDLRRCAVGRCQYTFLLAEGGADIVDDVMVWRLAEDDFLLTPSRTEVVLEALRAGDLGSQCEVEDVSSRRVLLAVQGAQARERAAEIAPACLDMSAFDVHEVAIGGHRCVVAATGFGRRIGFEFFLDPDAALAVHRSLLARGVVPVGLGMRETHRLEVGIPRHGLEFVPGVTPLEADAMRAVGLDGGSEIGFIGRAALERRVARGADRVLRTVVPNGRRVPVPGSEIAVDGRRVGTVTSSTYSPGAHCGLAFAFVEPGIVPESPVTVHTAQGAIDGVVVTAGAALGVHR